MRKTLILAGTASVALGMFLRACVPVGDSNQLWEKIPDEEVHTYIQKEKQRENMAVNEPVQEIEHAEIRQCSEGIPPSAGQINEFTYDEAQLLMRVAQAEAGNQGEDGMWMVMSVVLNRVEDEAWPDTIRDVIYQKSQFSSVSDGHFDTAVISPEAHEALARIESGDVTPEVIGFETISSTENDRYFDEAYVYRDHKFYVKKGD